MLTSADRECYARYRQHRPVGPWAVGAAYEPGLTMLLFGSIGAITWAIRGTTGWGGIDGTIVPGLTWGVLWYYWCARRGVDARGIVFWLGMGLALGGELGYGQYVSWIQGRFNVGDEVIPVSPLTGYLWFIICGIGWGAPGGIVLGWALGKPAGARQWTCRVALMGMLLVLLFNLGGLVLGQGIVEWFGEHIVRWCPGLLYPNADLGIYAGELDRHLGRTVYTNTQNFAVLLWWAAAMGLAAVQRDRTTLVCGAVIGGGFGPGFAIAAAWCHGYTYAPDAVDWWKVWELHSGFNLGLLYAIAMYWSLRNLDSAEHSGDAPHESPPMTTRSTFFVAGAGFVLVYCAGYEYFYWTGLALAAFFGVAMIMATQTNPLMGLACMGLVLFAGCQYGIWPGLVAAGLFLLTVFPYFPEERPTPEALAKRVRGISFNYSIFLLLFILLHGASSRAGVLLELYDDQAIDQYAWPVGRILLFAPAAAVLVLAVLWPLYKLFTAPEGQSNGRLRPERMFDLLTFIGIVGAVSIWPSKIGVLYAMFLALAVFALARLNRHFGKMDAL